MKKTKLIDIADIPPSKPELEVVGVFNAGSIMFNNQTILLLRVAERAKQTKKDVYTVFKYDSQKQNYVFFDVNINDKFYDFSDPRVIRNTTQNYLTSVSHLRLAKSDDGVHFDISPTPTIEPNTIYEEFGIEDPRITKIDDEFFITYVAVSGYGINTGLIKTKDFVNFHRCGLIFHSDNKDVILFPDKINGSYYALHRPSTSEFGKLNIWIAKSDNLLYWGNHQILLSNQDIPMESARLGGGCVPFLTKYGYVEIYHICNKDNEYCLCAVLLDATNPDKVLKVGKTPLIYPTEQYEKQGFFKNVVFSCGNVVVKNKVIVYYGACDTCVCSCELSLDEIYENLGV